MVGRAAEMATIESALLSAERGDGQLLVVSGESGLGKTRLALEARRHAEASGFTVLVGGCANAEVSLPYLPFVEALGDYLVGVDEDRLRENMGPAREELTHLFPSPPGETRAEGSDQVGGKLRLFEATLSLLHHVADDTGLVLVIEDIHWADQSSRDLLDYAARRLRRARTLLIATYRTEEVHRRHPLHALLRTWDRANISLELPLQPLNVEQVTEMIEAMLGVPAVGPAFARRVHQHTEGNPYIVEETLKDLEDAGLVGRPDSEWDNDELAARLRVPMSVSASIILRVNRLNPDHARVLAAAAVLGRSFNYTTLVSVSEQPESEVLEALQEAVNQQLLEEDPDSPSRYRFRHTLTREAVYQDLVRPRRQQLHSRAAHVMSHQALSSSIDIAHHLLAAGQWTEAVPAGLAAAADASRRLAYAEAADLYRRVLPHIEDPRLTAESQGAMGEAYLLAGDPAAAEEPLVAGIEGLHARGQELRAAHYQLVLGRALWERGDRAAARDNYEAARLSLAAGGPSDDLAVALVRLASLHLFEFEADEALELARAAASVAGEVGAEETRVWAEIVRGTGLAYQGNVEEGLEVLDRSFAEANAAGLQNRATNAIYSSIMIRLWNHRTNECPPLIAQMADMAPAWSRDLLVGRARSLTHLLQAEVSQALAAAEDVYSLVRRGGAENYQSWIDRVRALIHVELGHLTEAERLIPPVRAGEERQEEFFDLWVRGRFALSQGDHEAALDVGRRIAGAGWAAGNPLLVGLAVEILVAEGDGPSAQSLLERAEARGVSASNPMLMVGAGRVDLLEGNLDDARTHLAWAVQIFDRAGAALDATRSRIALAEALARSGDRATAQLELNQAAEVASRGGARQIVQEAQQMATRVGVSSPSLTAATHGGTSISVPDEAGAGRISLVTDLRAAMSGGGLVLFYQPKVTLGSRRLEGCEALLRWDHPRLGRLVPDRFIPVAEQSGLIKTLTTWVLIGALQQWRQWHEAGLDMTVSVNLSVHDLEDPRLARHIEGMLASAGAPPERLVLEVTETGVMSQPQRAIETLAQVRELGVRISIDDFGIGQSSLAYLRQLPADEIKVDKSFCMELDPKNLVIVRSAIAMGHDLGLKVTAEGIESAETLERLAALGCDMAQGYHIGRPAPAADLTERLLGGGSPA